MSFYALHPEAFIDLDEIWEFVAAENLAADRLVAEISEAVRQLVAFPHQGHHRPDLTSRPLRFVLVRDYLIAYAPDESPRSQRQRQSLLGRNRGHNYLAGIRL